MSLTCCYCGLISPRDQTTCVPRNQEIFHEWVKVLGDSFLEQVEKRKYPVVCLRHFLLDKKGKREVNAIPSENLIPQNITLFDPNDNDESSTGSKDSPTSSDLSDSSESYTPSNSSDETSDPDLAEISDEKSYNYVLCGMDSIGELLKFCRNCQTLACNISWNRIGACVKAESTCEFCGYVFKWTSSKVSPTKSAFSKDHLPGINLDLTTAIFATGTSYSDVQRIFFALKSPLFSKQTYHRLKKQYTYKAIDDEHKDMHDFVMKTMNTEIIAKGPIHGSGDAQWDSRGRTAMRCKYAILDCNTKFVLQYSTWKKKHGESSSQMETKLHEMTLQKLIDDLECYVAGNLPKIASLTTDRNKSVSKTMETQFPNVTLYYDSWHLLRNFVRDLHKKESQQQFIPMKEWIRSFINHVYWSVSSSEGDGKLAKDRLMSFFAHVMNIHSNFQNLEFYKFEHITRCYHPLESDSSDEGDSISHLTDYTYYLDLNDETDKKAWNIMLDIVTKGSRLSDIERVSPLFTTSAVESFNGRSSHFTKKDFFYSDLAFDKLTKLAIIDWNEKQKDEYLGKRTVVGERKVYCKTRKMEVAKTIKTTPQYNYLRSIMARARNIRFNESEGETTVSLHKDEDSDDEFDNDDEIGTSTRKTYDVETLISDARNDPKKYDEESSDDENA